MNNFQNDDAKNKKYYAVNLTEGRILAIFISFIIVVAALVFGVIFLFSNKNKTEDNKVIVESLEDKNNADFSYYNELDSQSTTPDIEKKESEKIETPVETEKKEFTVELDQKNEKVEKEDPVKLDNSKVLYSSEYIEKSESKEIKKPVLKNIKESVKTTAQNKKKTDKKTVKKSLEEKFIVQIGSYTNKKTADDISVFYKMQGFPAYIIEKKEKDKTFYRLRVGPYKEKNKAEENLLALKKSKYGENSFISKVYL